MPDPRAVFVRYVDEFRTNWTWQCVCVCVCFIYYLFFIFMLFYQLVGLAYDGHYTSNAGGHLCPHCLAAHCNNDEPHKVTPHCTCPDAIPVLFVSLHIPLGCTVGLHLLVL